MRSRHFSAALLISIAAFVALGVGQGGARESRAAAGGTFKIALAAVFLDNVDPALSVNPFLDLACARLVNYPDKPPPAAYRIVPEVAKSMPRVSNGGKTLTFTLRTNFRFSDGTPVRADAFARSIERNLIAERTLSDVALYTEDIVGAKAFIDGKADHVSGVKATGNRLVLSLVRPAANFLPRLTMPTFCAVPPTLPADPEGVGAFPGSGPYAITEYVRGKRVTLERNQYYGGTRPQRVDRFSVDLVGDFQEVVDRIERNEADWGGAPPPFFFDPARQLAGKYGAGKNRRFYSRPGLTGRAFAFNVARPLFRDNLALRRAVNFAVDRPKLTPDVQSDPSDQYLPRGLPGFKRAALYPLSGPDLRRAKALARGHTRGRKAVLLTTDIPGSRAAAQVLRKNLRAIGIELEIQALPLPSFYPRLAKADFDLVATGWVGAFPDPSDYMNPLFESRFIPSTNIGYFRSAKFDRMMRGIAPLSGEARFRAYGDLAVQLARDAAPRVQIAYEREPTFVSARVGCIVLRPELDLAAACLK